MTRRATTRRRSWPSRAVVPAAVLAAGLIATSCAAPADPAASTASTITLYNAQHEQTTDALIAAFTAQTGIKVQVDSNDEDVLTAQIEQEGSRSPADVVYTENSNWLAQLDQHNLLAPVDRSTLANVPAADSAANGDWVGVSARVSVFVYNTAMVSPAELPKSVLDLAGPAWKN